MTIFTYHQIMPAFIDFLFPFGRQEYAKDFHFSAFRHDTRLAEYERYSRIPKLGRSGLALQLCYSLKSVEPSKGQVEWPWSIRQSAVHHHFDVETGRTNWIIIKADQLMKQRIKSATNSRALEEPSSLEMVDRAFVVTLNAHLILCDWSGENWRWYINFLEEEFQIASQRILSESVEKPSDSILEDPSNLSMPLIRSQMNPSPSNAMSQNHRSSTSMSSRVYRKLRVNTNLSSPISEKTLIETDCSPKKEFSAFQPLPPVTPPATPPSPESPCVPPEEPNEGGQPEFCFSNLQRIQFIEEKANETSLVLKTNVNVLAELREHYSFIADSGDWPKHLRKTCNGEILRFVKRVKVVENDHRMHLERTENMIHLLNARKNLVHFQQQHVKDRWTDSKQLYGILEYRNMEASKFLAIEAHQSTRNMEIITQGTQSSTVNMEQSTKDMHEIAQKTKQETVSMRIITLVTVGCELSHQPLNPVIH